VFIKREVFVKFALAPVIVFGKWSLFYTAF